MVMGCVCHQTLLQHVAPYDFAGKRCPSLFTRAPKTKIADGCQLITAVALPLQSASRSAVIKRAPRLHRLQ